MKNQYVGDIGDYGKYGLLRFLANHGICIGVNWYLTENDDSADGKFTDYLKDKESQDRLCDQELFDALRKIVLPRSIQEKSVNMIREAELIPNACYYNSLLPDSNQDTKAREISRRFWLNNSSLMLGGADLIFADGSFIWSDQDPCQDWTPGASDGQTRAMPENDGTGQESHQASEESADEIQYVCNTNTKKFHYLSCDSVNQMNESNRMNTTLSRDELIAQGRCVPVARV